LLFERRSRGENVSHEWEEAKVVGVFPPSGEEQQNMAGHIPVFLLERRANS
jgi:hypothetical protein